MMCLAFCVLTYGGAGLIGYFIFGDLVEENVLNSAGNHLAVDIVRLLMVLVAAVLYPLVSK